MAAPRSAGGLVTEAGGAGGAAGEYGGGGGEGGGCDCCCWGLGPWGHLVRSGFKGHVMVG